MGIKTCDRYLTILFAAAVSSTGYAKAAGDDWQKERLLSPTPAQLAAETKGQVVIYDGLDSRVVDRALDEQFQRIDSMMFVRTRHTEPDGSNWVDDDCD
jgi:hypothetical protein